MRSDELIERLGYDRTRLAGRSIMVLAGGGSAEREISLDSGKAVYDALLAAGHQVSLLVTGRDHLSIDSGLTVLADPAQRALDGSPPEMALELFVRSADPIVFTTLHGTVGEDGIWQGMLELLGVPYVSAGVKGSAVAMDKQLSKLIMVSLGVPTPQWWIHEPGGPTRSAVPGDLERVVGKPIDQGSSVGVEIVANDDAGWRALDALAARFGRIIVERYIAGREVTAAVVGSSREPVALPLVMIEPTRQFYDYTAKYTSGASEYSCPAPLENGLTQAIQHDALQIYAALDLEPYARIDCIVSDQGDAYFLEANTLPGFTVNSLLPKAARAAGLEFTGLLEYLLCAAIDRHAQKGAAG